MKGILELVIFFAIAMVLSAVFTGLEIPVLKKKQFGQYIREEGPKSHLKKQGTPTMGGLAIYGAIVVAALFTPLAGAHKAHMAVMVVFGLLFGLIGFLDDFIKVAKKHNLGLRAWQKLVLQILFGVLLALYVMKFTDAGSNVWIPFINKDVDFGGLYVPFVAFVIVAMANSVNLTDGLDGLCAGVTAITSLFFAGMGFEFMATDSIVFCLIIAGACCGFLVFNHYPAKIFMGDTGSMALGAALTGAVVMMKAEFLIPFAGFVYVMESLSVIIQVISFKSTGKRVFRMAPIHHHFELGGMKEVQVVKMFYGFAVICGIIAVVILKI
ncbi:MAG: phospho-N-acetylmuramoyl-pentapeptide-transferase [Eubacteriales bacterium]|nr:phospho-N-acetylmuramoyl-pentapeptide-transferase [Eubacteriales bacterium]